MRRKGYRVVKTACAAVPVILGAALTAFPNEVIRWQDRVLPLPKEMEVAGHSTIEAGRIRYRIQARSDDPVFQTVRERIGTFAQGGPDAGDLTVTLVLLSDYPAAVPAGLRDRLQTLPNASQAYAVVTQHADPKEIVLAANTPVGLLYATHTLTQLIKPAERVSPDTPMTIPRVTIVDWPDIEWRGTWNSTGYPSMGWNSQWKMNIQNMKIISWRGDRRPGDTEIRRMDDIDTDTVRAYLRWAKELGYTYLPSIMHLGTTATRGLDGISPAVYTDENPSPRNPLAHGFCWAPGQEIYSVLNEEMAKAAKLAMEFPAGGRHIEVQLTEHTGTSCYCPDCGGESGYVLESRAIIEIFDALRAQYPVRLVILLSQGSRPVNDQILALAEGRPEIGFAYYDGQLTYRMGREPMIPDTIADFAREGGFIQVVLTLMPGRWDTNHPATVPGYIRTLAQEFVDKKMRSATQYDMYGAQFYYPMNMAAWGEFLWNANGRSVSDFARAYAVITGVEEPDLFVRWAKLADDAAMELGVSQYMVEMGNARYSRTPEFREDHEPQDPFTLRPDRALPVATQALELARTAGCKEMMWESEFVLAALRSAVVRASLAAAVQSEDRREEAAHLLDRFDVCARLVLATGYEWHRNAMDKRRALKEDASGFMRPPVWLNQMPWGDDPGRWQYRAWHNLLYVSDIERMTASLQGIPDLRGDKAPIDVAAWEITDFENRRAELEIDITDYIRPSGGNYLLGFHTLEGDGCGVELELFRVDGKTGEKRSVLNPRTRWDMRAGHQRDSFMDYLLDIPERAEEEEWVVESVLRSRGPDGSMGYITLRRVWSWDEFPQEKIDALLNDSEK